MGLFWARRILPATPVPIVLPRFQRFQEKNNQHFAIQKRLIYYTSVESLLAQIALKSDAKKYLHLSPCKGERQWQKVI